MLRLGRYSEPHPARTALIMLAMLADSASIDRAEHTLKWMAENRPTADAWMAALEELRLAVTANEEE